MIEVFKTNVNNVHKANDLIAQIQENFEGYRANFDLEDCDLILRVENPHGSIAATTIISLVERNGFIATVLEDSLTFFTT